MPRGVVAQQHSDKVNRITSPNESPLGGSGAAADQGSRGCGTAGARRTGSKLKTRTKSPHPRPPPDYVIQYTYRITMTLTARGNANTRQQRQMGGGTLDSPPASTGKHSATNKIILYKWVGVCMRNKSKLGFVAEPKIEPPKENTDYEVNEEDSKPLKRTHIEPMMKSLLNNRYIEAQTLRGKRDI